MVHLSDTLKWCEGGRGGRGRKRERRKWSGSERGVRRNVDSAGVVYRSEIQRKIKGSTRTGKKKDTVELLLREGKKNTETRNRALTSVTRSCVNPCWCTCAIPCVLPPNEIDPTWEESRRWRFTSCFFEPKLLRCVVVVVPASLIHSTAWKYEKRVVVSLLHSKKDDVSRWECQEPKRKNTRERRKEEKDHRRKRRQRRITWRTAIACEPIGISGIIAASIVIPFTDINHGRLRLRKRDQAKKLNEKEADIRFHFSLQIFVTGKKNKLRK